MLIKVLDKLRESRNSRRLRGFCEYRARFSYNELCRYSDQLTKLVYRVEY
uniref:Uncharacterized protein n=1 Tax=Zea mays TaxID=4577 RepID=B6SKJ0_MAIZE|nr:hypothetical protein [Zea mays]